MIYERYLNKMNISGKGTQGAKYVFVMQGSHCYLHANEMNIDFIAQT